ncbi:hypothetical protein [Burkholderia glumae]|uniref:hypothetical protein n=1 Tax=Burkholderia glumae TaxID=337 RepID=UPI0012FD5C1E|nr:hypothetical protein [Burkholderia glumae]QHE10533.1 hypothetical protein GQR88_09045 [Burkholderia glumae AU6208]
MGRMKRDPWAEVKFGASLQRLYLEAARRVARRQTGNEAAYTSLIEFLKDSGLVGEEFAGATSSEGFVDLILSFPADQAFLDRIYEIWCIRAIGFALEKVGACLREGPVPMTESRRRPIYSFELYGNKIEIWFQRALPKQGAEWVYESNGMALRGIPDVSIILNDFHYLLFDAKNRAMTGATMSEETYKMLGYFENFKSILSSPTSWGVVAFISDNASLRSLKSRNERQLELISAHSSSSLDCSFERQISGILTRWFDASGVRANEPDRP